MKRQEERCLGCGKYLDFHDTENVEMPELIFDDPNGYGNPPQIGITVFHHKFCDPKKGIDKIIKQVESKGSTFKEVV